MESVEYSVEMNVAERNFFIIVFPCAKEDELQTRLGQ